MRKEIRSALTLLVAAAIWGFAMAAQRKGAQYLMPFTFNACRFTLGAATLLPIMRMESRRTATPLTARSALPGMILGAVLTLAAVLQQMGVEEAGAGKAGFLTALYVVLVPVAGVFLRKKTRFTTWLALLLALPALYLLCVPAGEAFSLAASDGWVLLSAVFWTVHILLLDQFVVRISALKLCVMQFSTAAVLSWVLAAATETISAENLRAALWPLAYCGILSTGVGYLFQALGQRGCKPALAALIMSLESVFCVIAGAVLLGERMEARGYVGCALMLLAVLLAQLGAFWTPSKEEKRVSA